MLLLPAAVRDESVEGIVNMEHPAVAICGSRPSVGFPEAGHPTAIMAVRDQAHSSRIDVGKCSARDHNMVLTGNVILRPNYDGEKWAFLTMPATIKLSRHHWHIVLRGYHVAVPSLPSKLAPRPAFVPPPSYLSYDTMYRS